MCLSLVFVCVLCCAHQRELIGVGLGLGRAQAEKLLTLSDWGQEGLEQHGPKPGYRAGIFQAVQDPKAHHTDETQLLE